MYVRSCEGGVTKLLIRQHGNGCMYVCMYVCAYSRQCTSLFTRRIRDSNNESRENIINDVGV